MIIALIVRIHGYIPEHPSKNSLKIHNNRPESTYKYSLKNTSEK